MDLYEAIGTRRTVREFSPQPVEEDKLHRVLHAGLMAPANAHMRDWSFILVKDTAARMTLVEIEGKRDAECYDVEEIRRRFGHFPQIAQDVYVYAVPLQKRMLLAAPELLVVCFPMPKPLQDCRSLYDLNSLASAWCCIENILLAMASEGLYGVTYIPQNYSGLRQVLGIPQGREIAAIIPIGYPASNAIRPKQDDASLGNRIFVDRHR